MENGKAEIIEEIIQENFSDLKDISFQTERAHCVSLCPAQKLSKKYNYIKAYGYEILEYRGQRKDPISCRKKIC